MPWHITREHPDCSGYGVVKDDDGKLVGCHRTRQEAEDQLAALHASEGKEHRMLTKNYRASFKALKDADGAPTGEVTAVVSVFGNVDLVGDVVQKTAFDADLVTWKDSGDPIPMIWSHDWANPMSHIGAWDAASAVATDEGLQLTGKVFIGEGNPVADQAFKLMEQRLVREFSFAYDVLDESPITDGPQKGANSLNQLALIEAGPTLKGANPDTRLVEAKAAEVMDALARGAKVGRALSAKNEATLREAVDAMKAASKAIDSVLSAVAATEEPKGLKHDEEPEPITTETFKCEVDGCEADPFKTQDELDAHALEAHDVKSDEEQEDAKSFALRMRALLA